MPADDPADGRRGDPEERGELAHGEVRAAVHRHEQDAVLQGQCPWAARPVRVQSPATVAVDSPHQTLELAQAEPSEHLYELMALSRDNLHDQLNAAPDPELRDRF
ncbi:hypothetical protein GCM10018779_33750 [Streptomyces griseocarneus]|nr:hypothetical protein GCM10018779_33750 [Streptomyces griseocarneus]